MNHGQITRRVAFPIGRIFADEIVYKVPTVVQHYSVVLQLPASKIHSDSSIETYIFHMFPPMMLMMLWIKLTYLSTCAYAWLTYLSHILIKPNTGASG